MRQLLLGWWRLVAALSHELADRALALQMTRARLLPLHPCCVQGQATGAADGHFWPTVSRASLSISSSSRAWLSCGTSEPLSSCSIHLTAGCDAQPAESSRCPARHAACLASTAPGQAQRTCSHSPADWARPGTAAAEAQPAGTCSSACARYFCTGVLTLSCPSLQVQCCPLPCLSALNCCVMNACTPLACVAQAEALTLSAGPRGGHARRSCSQQPASAATAWQVSGSAPGVPAAAAADVAPLGLTPVLPRRGHAHSRLSCQRATHGQQQQRAAWPSTAATSATG